MSSNMMPYWYPEVAFPPDEATESVTAAAPAARRGTDRNDSGAIAEEWTRVRPNRYGREEVVGAPQEQEQERRSTRSFLNFNREVCPHDILLLSRVLAPTFPSLRPSTPKSHIILGPGHLTDTRVNEQ